MWTMRLLILLVGMLRAEEVPLALAKEYADTEKYGHTYEVLAGDNVFEIFKDNREGHCCPDLGRQEVTDEKEKAICLKIWRWATKVIGPQSYVISMLVWMDEGLPSFSIQFHGYSDRVPVTASEPLTGRECCLRGHLLANGEMVNDDIQPIHSELMGMSKTVKVKVTKWRLHDIGYPFDYDEFLNSVKATSSFVGKEPGELHYLATEIESQQKYEDYVYFFDSTKVLRVWSNNAAKVFKAYAKSKVLCSKDIKSMHVYKDWMVIHTDCGYIDSPGPMPDYFLKMIKHEWVLVWDDFSSEDPRYRNWLPKKNDYKKPGINFEDIPEQLRSL